MQKLQYTLRPVYVIRKTGPFLFGHEVLIKDVLDSRGKRKSPRRCISDGDRILATNLSGTVEAWFDPENLQNEKPE